MSYLIKLSKPKNPSNYVLQIFNWLKTVVYQFSNPIVLVIISMLVTVSLNGCISLLTSNDFLSQQDRILYQTGESVAEYSNISTKKLKEIADSDQISIDRLYSILIIYGAKPAELEARKYISVNPGDLDGYQALARILYTEKKLEMASYYANYVLTQDNQHLGMHNLIGLIKLYQARTAYDFRQAELHFAKIIDDPEYGVVAMTNLGFMYLEIAALNRAQKIFTRLYQDCDKCTPSLLGLGIVYRRLDDPQQSLKFLKMALRKSLSVRTKHKFYYNLALVLRKDQKTIIKASEYLQDILKEADEKQEIYNRALSLLNEIKLNFASES